MFTEPQPKSPKIVGPNGEPPKELPDLGTPITLFTETQQPTKGPQQSKKKKSTTFTGYRPTTVKHAEITTISFIHRSQEYNRSSLETPEECHGFKACSPLDPF